MRKQRVEFVDHRLHFERQWRLDTAVLPAAHRRDRAPDMAQRPEAVEGLECCKNDQSEPQHPEAGDQCRAYRADLFVERLARRRDLEPPPRLDRKSTRLNSSH